MSMPDGEIIPEELELAERLRPGERDIEAPDADAIEQATPLKPLQTHTEFRRGLEVSEYDALEQAWVVELEDDEYR